MTNTESLRSVPSFRRSPLASGLCDPPEIARRKKSEIARTKESTTPSRPRESEPSTAPARDEKRWVGRAEINASANGRAPKSV